MGTTREYRIIFNILYNSKHVVIHYRQFINVMKQYNLNYIALHNAFVAITKHHAISLVQCDNYYGFIWGRIPRHWYPADIPDDWIYSNKLIIPRARKANIKNQWYLKLIQNI